MSSARQIIRNLINKRLAACGNVFKIASVYNWKGKIERAAECAAFIKTKASHYKKAERYIRQNHPYEVPEIISWPIKRGLKEYLNWIDAST